MYEVLVIDTPTLGDRSYLVHDGSVAFVVDPQRDIDRVVDLAAAHGVRITDVFETHIHNDYVTGGYALARLTGARYHVNAADPARFDRHPARDGEQVVISPSMTVRVAATPGHTHTHLAYALEHGGRIVAVFSGGSLLYGSTGRPDLLGPDHTATLVRDQWATAHRLAELAPDDAALYPTHGFGSFCSATQSDAGASTIGTERRSNPVLLLDRASWIAQTLAGLDAWPAYYAHMGPANLSGPGPADLTPPAVADPEELRRRIEAGEWVVDLRHRKAFCESHLAGSLSFGLDGSIATYIGWLIPWGTPITLLGETADDVATAQSELARIGIDRPAAAAIGDAADWAGPGNEVGQERATFVQLAAARRENQGVTVIDARERLEWEAGHLAGARHIPLAQLPDRLGELPDGPLWVHCQTGYRATIAASLLARAGRSCVLVDEAFEEAAAAGLTIER